MPIPERHLHPVETIPADGSIREAARRMRDARVGALVTVDADGRAIGIVTDRDLALTALRNRLDPETTPASLCTSTDIALIGVETDPLEAAAVMRRRGIRRLPVVDSEGRLVGMLTADDLIRAIAEDLRWVAEAIVRGYENEQAQPRPQFSIFGEE